MKKLTLEGWEKARTFVNESARPLERSLFAHHFEGGTAEDVLAELAGFQNADGGFGRALEPDLRLADSSAIATTVGLRILSEVEATEDRPLVRGAIRYLLDTYDLKIVGWPIIPPNVDDAPHAPWWSYSEALAEQWNGFLANPRAEIVRYLHDYADLVPQDLLAHLSDAVLSHLESLPDEMEMHDLGCYIRLAETQTLPEAERAKIIHKLKRAVDCMVARDPSDWEGYGLKPLSVAASPESPFAEMLAKEIDLNLDYEIEHQQKDGSWAPTWSWGDAFPETWEEARREWKGVLTVNMVKVLQDFGRLE